MEVLVIKGHDYSKFIARKGVAWRRQDSDGGFSVQTLDGVIHRPIFARKRDCTYTLINMSRSEIAQLDTDISDAAFEATYLDLHGIQTRRFFCEGISAITSYVSEDTDNSEWAEVTFTLNEV